MSAPARTGWVFDEWFLWHDTGTGAGPFVASGWIEPMEHIEAPAAKRRFANLVAVSGLGDSLISIPATPATIEQIEAVHTREHRERIEAEAASGRGDAGDGSSPFGAESYRVALLAAGGVIAAVDAVLDGAIDNAYALVRPPGHHAMRANGWGFCIFNNVAVAAAHLRSRGLARVCVVDLDVHHGNGTEEIFAADPSVLTISIHQDGAYPPGSGPVDHIGEGAGRGTNLNIPLPPGSGAGAYEAALLDVVVPAIRRFQPEFIVVASGFDANGMDPMARQMLSSAGFAMCAQALRDVADDVCDGRVVFAHEGGYSPFVVPFCGLAVLEVLSGITTDVVDPFRAGIEGYGQGLLDHQRRAVDAAQQNVELVPEPPSPNVN